MKRAVVVGGGFAGCTAAFMLREKGFDVSLFEGSDVLGGGCRTFFYHGHPYTFGPHHLLIRIDDGFVWDYLSRFLTLRKLHHHNLTYVSQDDCFYSYPIHEDDIEIMPDRDRIREEIGSQPPVQEAKDFEEYWERSVGPTLYEKFIKTYSRKMWQIDDNRRIDEFGFSPKGVALKSGSKECFEGQKIIAYPVELDGYNSYFEKCVAGCSVNFNAQVDKFDLDKKRVRVKGEWIEGDIIISSASVDSLFDYAYGELKYIGRDLIKIILPVERITPDPYYFIYYAGDEPFTRVVEYKLLTGYKSPDTLIGVEFPSFNNRLYPYPFKSEIGKAKKYLDSLPENVYSIGRLGRYHYDNMDMIVKDCFEIMKEI